MEEEQVNTLGLPHLRRALVEEKRPIMYKVMKFWGKKPHNIFRTYIQHYSHEEEIILDPFAGSGVCLLEAIQVNRKAIGIDLNPISIFFIDRLITILDINKFTNEYVKLKKQFNEFEFNSGLYLTKCEICKQQKGRVINLHYDDDKPYFVTYICNCSKKAKKGLIKKPDNEDLDLIKNSENLNIEWWYPKDGFPTSETFYEARTKVGNHFYDLWTKRNLYILSYINNEMEKIEDIELKKFFKFAFASMLHLCTKMVSARDLKSKRPFSGSWGRPAYFFPARHLEQNSFVLFERAIEDKQGLIKAKKMSNKLLSNKVRLAKDFDDLKNNNKNLLLLKMNILDIKEIIPENEIHYILTDPPYGNLIQYFDLSSIWSVWLKGEQQDKFFDMPYTEEIIAKSLKGISNYEKSMLASLKLLYKVLIPNRYLTLTFHNSNPVIYDLIMKICFMSGFAVEKIQFQPNRRASESGVAHPYGSAISDYYIRLKKPSKDEVQREGLNKEGFEKVVVETAKRVIAMRGQPTELPFLIDDIITEIYKYGQYFEDTKSLKRILEKRLNKEFVIISKEIKIQNKTKKIEKWWLKNPDEVIKHGHIPLSDRIERVVIGVLNEGVKISFEDILKKIYEEFPNSLTPATDGNKIKRLLSEYADKTADGKWVLNSNRLDKSKTQHLNIIILLAEIGKKLGFDIWCADRNKDERLKKICLDKLELKECRLERIKEIDVIWLGKNKIVYIFEVENTTDFTNALIRASNIIQEDKIIRVITIPRIRINLLKEKLKEPLFEEYYKKDDWKILLYEDVIYFSNKRSSNLTEFDKLLKNEPEKREQQIILS